MSDLVKKLEKQYLDSMNESDRLFQVVQGYVFDDLSKVPAEKLDAVTEWYQATYREFDALIAWQNEQDKEMVK